MGLFHVRISDLAVTRTLMVNRFRYVFNAMSGTMLTLEAAGGATAPADDEPP